MKRLSRTLLSISVVLCMSEAGVALPQLGSAASNESSGIRVQGPGIPPQLGFACCDRGIVQMQALFADPGVIAALKELRAQVAVAIIDFSPERVEIVHRLNEDGVPVIAWIVLAPEDGYYLNADTASKAAARVGEFEKWTNENGLRWAAVGLDIEPNFGEFAQLKAHRWRLFTTLVRNSFNGHRIAEARRTYSTIIAELQGHGYVVQSYQMPYLPAERSVHSTALDRLLGTVDVRGNEEYLMLYTSFARPVGAGMIWSLGRNAQAIAIGVTDGDTQAGSGMGPLDWNEFSRDLIVASHYTSHVGVYNLEGCVRQGFLPRLQTMDWSQSVVLPAASIQRAERTGRILRTALRIFPYIPFLLLAALVLLVLLVRRRLLRRRKA
ncbi:MAG: hypothetical protein WB561_16790 [Terracidiphilus sp.]